MSVRSLSFIIVGVAGWPGGTRHLLPVSGLELVVVYPQCRHAEFVSESRDEHPPAKRIYNIVHRGGAVSKEDGHTWFVRPQFHLHAHMRGVGCHAGSVYRT